MSLAKFKVATVAQDKGQRGKWAEGEVRDVLKAMSDADKHFAFNRNLDARSAGGRFPAQAGDFQWFYLHPPTGDTYNGIVEVKEVQHLRLLPFKNLDTDSAGRMQKREWAGSQVLILVAHRLPKMASKDVKWRAADLSYFADRSKEKGVGSWDMSDVPFVDYRLALRGLIT